jgi:thiol-disulfide isomerase/thioredoxin
MTDMRRTIYLLKAISMFSILLLAGCSDQSGKLGQPVKGSKTAYASFSNYWSYYMHNLKFYKQFEAYDTDATQIPADSFMAKYGTGEYEVYKYIAHDTVLQYKLEKLKPEVEDNIRNQLRSQSLTDYNAYKKQGKPLAGFNFVDLDGKPYTLENTRGKYVVIKFWFIGCVPCVKEMPELNEIVARNKERDDVIFLSIALDSEPALRKFLTTRKFDYKTVGNKKEYVADTLAINQFPTHLVIGKDGNVIGSCSWVPELKDLLKQTTVKI